MLTDMLNSWNDLFGWFTEDTRNKTDVWVTCPETINLLRAFVVSLRPNLLVEIGTEFGYTTTIIAQTMQQVRQGKIITIDIAENLKRQELWELAGVNKLIKQIIGDSKKVWKYWGYGKIDMLYIDGDHSFDGFLNDFWNFGRLVKKGGLIFCHDSELDGISGCFEMIEKYFDKPFEYQALPFFQTDACHTHSALQGYWIVKKLS